VLVRARDGKLQVRTTARAEQDIRTALRLAEEFGYQTVLEEATEAYQVADVLAQSKVKVVFGAPSASSDADGAEPRLHTLLLLAKSEVPFAIASGSRVGTPDLAREAMFAIRNGLPREVALAATTLVPSQILGVDGRVGSLEAGKDADLVVWTGEPFDPLTTARAVYVGGVEVK
jgi:imidazolonepropionase-like amidohydrolase